MYHKILFLLTILLSGCTAVPKTEVTKAPPSEKVVFYSDIGKKKEIGCVNIYRLLTQSLAAKEAEKISKELITQGSHALELLRKEIETLEVLTKLKNKIETIEDTSKEFRERLKIG